MELSFIRKLHIVNITLNKGKGGEEKRNYELFKNLITVYRYQPEQPDKHNCLAEGFAQPRRVGRGQHL
jgi:hypothetical protein